MYTFCTSYLTIPLYVIRGTDTSQAHNLAIVSFLVSMGFGGNIVLRLIVFRLPALKSYTTNLVFPLECVLSNGACLFLNFYLN